MTENKEREEWVNSLMGEDVSVSEVILAQIKKINFLWEELDKLTDVVKTMSDHLIKVSDAAKEFKKDED